MPFKDGIWYDDEDDENEGEEPIPPVTDPPSIPSIPLQPATPIAKPITQSILLTIKKMLGIAEEYHAFDIDIIVNINSVFLTLNQLGVGPTMPYQITGTEEVWSDFLGNQQSFLPGVRTYIYLKTRLLFDPPTNSFLVNSFEKQISELEWRFTVQPKSDQELSYQQSFKQTYPSATIDPEEPPTTEPETPPLSEEEAETTIQTFALNDPKAVSVATSLRKARVAKKKKVTSLLDKFA